MERKREGNIEWKLALQRGLNLDDCQYFGARLLVDMMLVII